MGKVKRIERDSLEIGKLLSQQRDALHRQFSAWVELECQFSRWHAYRFMYYYATFKDRDLSAYNIATTTLMYLAQPKVDEATREALLDRSKKERVTAADVREALGEAQAKREERIANIIMASRPIVGKIVEKWKVDDPVTVDRISQLAARNNTDTLFEIYQSGYIQPGEEHEAVHITAGGAAVGAAIDAKAHAHRQAAIDERTCAVVYLRGRVERVGDSQLLLTLSEQTHAPDINGHPFSGQLRIFHE